jgi:hypothetical protein
MPILDHFRPPLLNRPSWEGVHRMWAASIARSLNRRWLPDGYRAEVEWHFGPDPVYKADVGVVAEPAGATYTIVGEPPREPYKPPPADAQVLGVLCPSVRVLVRRVGESRLQGAVELVSEANKDRPASCDGFAAKMQTYLQGGASLVVADLVTTYRARLHDRWAELFAPTAPRLPDDDRRLYAAAYRPDAKHLSRGSEVTTVDLWLRPLAPGDALPTLPLFLDDAVVPIELEETYVEALGDARVPVPEPAAV